VAKLKALEQKAQEDRDAALREQQAERDRLLREQQKLLDQIRSLQQQLKERQTQKKPAPNTSSGTTGAAPGDSSYGKTGPATTGSSFPPTTGNTPSVPKTGVGKRADTTAPNTPSTPATKPRPDDFRVVQLSNLKANDAARVLNELFARDRGNNLTIVAEPATNSILVRGSAEQQEAIMAILVRLEDAARDTAPPRRGEGTAPGKKNPQPSR
jgi:type II secretory pathway component GspD/PulD (secretin)